MKNLQLDIRPVDPSVPPEQRPCVVANLDRHHYLEHGTDDVFLGGRHTCPCSIGVRSRQPFPSQLERIAHGGEVDNTESAEFNRPGDLGPCHQALTTEGSVRSGPDKRTTKLVDELVDGR
jgi:hypothetical protein